jgi:hypothetical protein
MDWTDGNFVAIFFLFIMNWISSASVPVLLSTLFLLTKRQQALWQYIILYYLGALTNDPVKSAHYAGAFRGCLGAGEAICFGVDSIAVP